MRNLGVIQVGMRLSVEIRFRSRAWQRHRECRLKIEAAPSLARLGTFARLRLSSAASARPDMSCFYFHRKAALFLSGIASSLRSPNKAPEPTTTAVTAPANECIIK